MDVFASVIVGPVRWACSSLLWPFPVFRRPLHSRTVIELRGDPDLPGAPAGDYVMLEYRSRFANDPATTEQVILLLEDGVWRGFGYSVRAVPR
jgi:hypothetical protein